MGMQCGRNSHHRQTPPPRHFLPLFLLLFSLTLTSPAASAVHSSTCPLHAREPPPLCRSPAAVIPRRLHLVRRSSDTAHVGYSEQPLRECKNKIYCLPSPNVTWYNEEVGWIQWNNQNDRFISGSRQVNIYLYERVKGEPSTDNEHNLLAAFKNIENASGLFNLTVSDAIFSKWNPTYYNVSGSSNATRAHFVVVTWPENTLDAEKGNDFFISSLLRPRTSQTSKNESSTSTGEQPTVTHTIASNPVALDEVSTKRDMIIIGCIGSVMFLAFLVVVCVFMRRKQKREERRKSDMRNSSLPMTRNSATPLFAEKAQATATSEPHLTSDVSSTTDVAAMPLPSDAAMAPATLRNPTDDDDVPLSSSDARLIALTYRQMLRKPKWQTMPGEEETLTPEEEEERKRAEEEARRRSEAIMRRELEEDGRGLKTVSVHSIYDGKGTAASSSARTSSTSSPAPEYQR